MGQLFHPAARIVGSHGYRIDGDRAVLNADIEWSPSARSSPRWALKLWARPVEVPGGLGPVLVAELPLLADAIEPGGAAHVEGFGIALPPAGRESYTMVLQLSSTTDATVHDEVAFGQAERFVQPRLQQAGVRREGDSLWLEAVAISNPRRADNLSGHLVLELWALAAPYRGGAFEGTRLASSALGRLAGQQAWNDVSVSTAAAPRPAQLEHVCLMLREWTEVGYVTRDYVEVSDEAAAQPQADAQAKPAATPEPAVTAQATLPAEPLPSVVSTPPQIVLSTPPKTGGVSINHASEAQLAAVKGLPKAVAKALIAGRPYPSLDGLLAVKGMGPKLLEKLRSSLSI